MDDAEADSDETRLEVPTTTTTTASAAPPSTSTSTAQGAFLRRGALERRFAAKGAQARLRRLTQDDRHQPRERHARSLSSSSTASSSLSSSSSSFSSSSAASIASSRGFNKAVLKPPVPKADDLSPLLRLPPRNHIVANRAAASHSHGQKHPRAVRGEEGPFRHEAFGRIPDYLMVRVPGVVFVAGICCVGLDLDRLGAFGDPRNPQQRQQELAAAEERKRAERGDPDCPLGMRLLSEAERDEVLAALDAQEKELQRLLLRVPLKVRMVGCQN